MRFRRGLFHQSLLGWRRLRHFRSTKTLSDHPFRPESASPPPLAPASRAFGSAAAPSASPSRPESPVTARRRALREAQSVLLDYLQFTRGLGFLDAEHMSKRSPIFLEKLVDMAGIVGDKDACKTLRRTLRFNPINEFEVFFESIGLDPHQVEASLPDDKIFLADDGTLLSNYRYLCEFGFDRGSIGKIYLGTPGAFRLADGALVGKLRALLDAGLSQHTVIAVVCAGPSVLVDNAMGGFADLLNFLEAVDLDRNWIGTVLPATCLCNWRRITDTLELLTRVGLSKAEVGALLRRDPDSLFNSSGLLPAALVAGLTKFGCANAKLVSIFTNASGSKLQTFIGNMRTAVDFLVGIGMDPDEITRLMAARPEVFGACTARKPKTALCHFAGRRRLCQALTDDPAEYAKFAVGGKMERLPPRPPEQSWLEEKTRFLSLIGYEEDSPEWHKALATFRGRGQDLVNRYESLVRKGFEPADAARMIRVAPHVLNQQVGVLEAKIDCIVGELGYPLAALVVFPAALSYTLKRVRLRWMMCRWLVDRQMTRSEPALSTLLAWSEKKFVSEFVMRHPEGLQAWEELQRRSESDS